jgi:uncharacterized protein (DUF1015 family)
VPRFTPFAGVRYATSDGSLDDLVAPPYDVISLDDRARLVNRSPHNAVRIELPAEEDGRDRYEVAASLWSAWRAEGVLVSEDEPAFYAYRMTFRSEDGSTRHTLGVLGALELSRPGEGGILPHERTTAKDKADRLNLLRSCQANLSPIWGLSLTEGLTALLPVDSPPDAVATDEDGTTHELWVVSDPAVLTAISDAVAGAAVVIADGHHRYETALAYRDEVGGVGGSGSVLAYVVELTEEQLAVGPIHRLLSGLDKDFDLVGALAPFFDMRPINGVPPSGVMALCGNFGVYRLDPKPATLAAAEADLDSSRLDVALKSIPATVTYQHGYDRVMGAIAKGEADAAVLLRPATVAQIAETGRGGERMPPKTTFFFPKPRTGMVFRAVDG